ncbi:MAG: hypothetical protein U0167_15525 [bacterium]
MFADWLAGSDLLVWPLVGLGIFFVTFLGVLIHVLLGMRDAGPRSRVAALPLDDDAGAPLGDGRN